MDYDLMAGMSRGEKVEYKKQLKGFRDSERHERRQDDCCAEVLSAVINQSILDALAPPRKATSTKERATYDQGIIEKTERDGIDFIESEYLDAFFLLIKILGRSSSNAKVIRRLVRRYRSEGKYIVIQGMVTNEVEWRELSSKSFYKSSKTKKDLSDAKAQGNGHEEELLAR